jgi:hypothetical protein
MDWYHDTVIAGVLRHLDFGTILAMRRVNKRTLHVANTMFPVDFMKKIKQFMDFGQYSVDVNTPGLLLEQIALNQYLITYIG